MCLISDCQRRSRCKARDALLGCPPPLLVEPSKERAGERESRWWRKSLARSRLRIRVKSFCATSSGPLCPGTLLPLPLPPSYRFSDRVAAKPTSSTLFLLSLSVSLFLSLSLSLFDGVHPRVHCYSGDRVEHRCFISFDDTHLAIESPMRRAMGIISNRIVTVIFSFLSLFSWYLFVYHGLL